MNARNFAVMAALTVAMVGVPGSAARANDGSVDLRFYGANFVNSTVDGRPSPLDGRVATARQSGIVKGRGRGIFASQAVLEEVPANPADFPADCLAMGQAGSDIFVAIVVTYNDGSILTLVTTGPDSFFCTDGAVFTIEFEGIVTGGEGRFEGATGTWEGTAHAQNFRVTAAVEVDLHN